MKSVVVVGAGIIGLCCAWYLSDAGCEVTIVDRGPENGDNCSQGNSGMIVPSHFVPLASPGMIGYGLRQLLQSDSPFGVTNPFDREFLSWARLFSRSARAGRCDAASLLLRDLQLSSRLLYSDLHAKWNGAFTLNESGLLSIALTQEHFDEEAKTVEVAHRLGLRANLLDAHGIRDIDPGTEMRIVGGTHYPDDACIDPTEFIRVLRSKLVERGVGFEWNSEITGRTSFGRSITSIHSASKRFRSDAFVLATGAATTPLGRKFGIGMPMLAGRGYSLTEPNPASTPKVCALVPERRLAMTPMGGRVRFGGSMELGDPGRPINSERVQGIVGAIREVYPAYANVDLESLPVWAGDRPCTPDGLPYIGLTNTFGNLMIAAGHAMSGVSLAPITGKLVAEVVLGRSPSITHPFLDPNRYA